MVSLNKSLLFNIKGDGDEPGVDAGEAERAGEAGSVLLLFTIAGEAGSSSLVVFALSLLSLLEEEGGDSVLVSPISIYSFACLLDGPLANKEKQATWWCCMKKFSLQVSFLNLRFPYIEIDYKKSSL